ncbi:HU family DNA-binding protein [Saccharicrinis aurantiacus]|uniref:HU family DNA-binding protein n=1 Tax=Saccharicrinis aurantiacus TaxID=1849719 RepID=UPI002491840E|nr:HU family DNA-binding protein [Saccharicrinis aurantiacus]
MGVKYKSVAKKNPRNAEDIKYYIQQVRNETIGRREFEVAIIEKTALSKAEARGVLVTIADVIREELLRGNAVKLEDLGTFSLRLKSEGAETPEEVTANKLKNVSVGYRPSGELVESIQKIKLEKTE